jgi:hypothetical protein
MYLNFSQSSTESTGGNTEVDLKRIYLVPEDYITEEDQFYLQIRRMDEHRNIVPMGNIVAQKGRVIDLPRAPGFFAISAAYAQLGFNWYGHDENYQFCEEYIDRFTIRRYYDDGWVLEYNVDEQGHSIPSSFRWIAMGN